MAATQELLVPQSSSDAKKRGGGSDVKPTSEKLQRISHVEGRFFRVRILSTGDRKAERATEESLRAIFALTRRKTRTSHHWSTVGGLQLKNFDPTNTRRLEENN